ncbi:MAG: DUF697 domain-containing protein [Bacteroidales bacterium]|nr:DUF697 domain-containing protein [Bacteroidales bacterium]
MENKKNEPTMEETKSAQIENDQLQLDEASKVVKTYMYWSMGAGLIPIPLVDVATVSGVQLKMLSEISKIYGIKFSENLGKSVIGALIGGITANALSKSYFTSWIKSIPIIGILGAVSMPIFSGATTWALGKVFIQHFAAGGTLLNFDPQKVKDYFAELYKQGETMAKNMKTAAAE